MFRRRSKNRYILLWPTTNKGILIAIVYIKLLEEDSMSADDNLSIGCTLFILFCLADGKVVYYIDNKVIDRMNFCPYTTLGSYLATPVIILQLEGTQHLSGKLKYCQLNQKKSIVKCGQILILAENKKKIISPLYEDNPSDIKDEVP